MSLFAQRLRAHCERQLKAEARDEALAAQTPRWQAVWRPERSQVCAGDDLCERFLWLLDNLGFVRNQDQVDFLWPFFYALLPRFYGRDWRRESARVLKQWGLERIDLYVLAIAMRRLGKTTAVCLAQTAAIICIPGLNQAILATNMRITTLIQHCMIRMLGSRPECKGQYWTSKDRLIYSHVPRVDDEFHVPWLEKATRKTTVNANGVDESISCVTSYPGSNAKGKNSFSIHRFVRFVYSLVCCISRGSCAVFDQGDAIERVAPPSKSSSFCRVSRDPVLGFG